MLKAKFRVFILFVALIFPLVVHAEVRNVSSNGVFITGSFEERILELVNEARRNEGLSDLSLDYNLTLAARQRAAELGVFYDGGHRRSDLRGFRSVLDDYHISYSYSGENIAYGYGTSQYTTPEGVVNVWLNSAPHRANILNVNYNALGLGIFKGPNNRYYWVQDFTNNLSSTYQPNGSYQESNSHTRVRYEDYNSSFQYANPGNIELNVGDQYTLQYQISTQNAGSDESILLTLFDWTSSNSDIVSIEDNGSIILHANQSGSATVQTTFQDQLISFTVTVLGQSSSNVDWLQVITSENQMKSVSLENVNDYSTFVYLAEDTLYNGVTQFYSSGEIINPSSYQVAFCRDEVCSNPTYPIQYQSLDENICNYVDGKFIFNNSGQTTITAIFENGIQVNIPVDVSLLKFKQSEYQVQVGNTLQTSVITDYQEYSFVSSNSNVVTINENGLLTGILEDTAEVYVIGEHQVFSKAKVTVLPMPQIRINVGQYDVVLVEDESLDLNVETDPNNASLSYSSDDSSIASVSQDGVIRGVHEGSTIIHVTSSLEHYRDNSLDIHVTITPKSIPVESIQVDKANLRLEVGDEEIIHASPYPSNADNALFQFVSRNPNIAAVDSNGKVSAIQSGETVIIIQTANGVQATISVVVLEKSIETTIEVNQTQWRLYVQDTAQLIVQVNPEQNLEWYSDNPDIVTIDSNLIMTAISEGMATIHIVSEDQKEVQVVVYVNQFIPISDLVVSDSPIVLEEGDTFQVQATVLPDNTTESKTINWTSRNPSVASVSSSGLISANAIGETTITVTTSNGIERELTIVVQAPSIPISSINVSKDSLSLMVDESSSIEVTLEPDNTTDSLELVWSSEHENIASVDNNGVITAHSEGNTIITVTTSNGLTASIYVYVYTAQGEFLSLNSHEIIVKDFNETLDIDANFDLNKDDIEWIVDDPSIIRFQDNKIIPLQYGETRIIFRYQEFVDICRIVVSREFSNTTLGQFKNSNTNLENHSVLYVLANTQATYQVILEDTIKDYLNDSITWSVDNTDVLEVNQNGLVFFKKAGYGKLTASSGMYSSDLYFYVYGMNIYSDSNAIYVGDTTRIHVDVTTPDYNHSTSCKYSIKNQHLATISKDGVLTGTHPGSVEVVVYSEDNKVYKTITIQIMNNPPNYFNVIFDQNTFTVSNRNGTAVLEIHNIKEQIESSLVLSSNEELISAYDISFKVGDNSTFTDPIYHIILPITIDRNVYESVYVAYVVDGKIVEVFNVLWNDDSIEFDVTHFSQYAIIGLLKSKSDSPSEDNNSKNIKEDSKTIKKQNESNNPQTGNNIILYIVIWIVAFLLLNRFTTILFHKKKND